MYNGDDEVLSLPFSFDHSGYEIFDFDCKYIVEIGWNLSFVEFNRAFITVTPFEDIIGDDPITIELNLDSFEVKSAEGVEPGIIYVDPQVDNNQKNNVVPLYVIIPFAVIGGIVVIFVFVFAIMKLVKKNKRGI